MKIAVFGFFFIAVSIGLATWYVARFLERGDF
jgi:cytochrome oxidase assembly protein ShyY1